MADKDKFVLSDAAPKEVVPDPAIRAGVEFRLQQRELTASEREHVAPRVTRIEQLRLAIASARHGGAWTNRLNKELRAEERALERYVLDDLSLHAVTWQDEHGRKRRLEYDFQRPKFKVIIS